MSSCLFDLQRAGSGVVVMGFVRWCYWLAKHIMRISLSVVCGSHWCITVLLQKASVTVWELLVIMCFLSLCSVRSGFLLRMYKHKYIAVHNAANCVISKGQPCKIKPLFPRENGVKQTRKAIHLSLSVYIPHVANPNESFSSFFSIVIVLNEN